MILGFPNPSIPKIVGQPTYEKQRENRALLKENAASVHSALEGGYHGHLRVCMDATTYAAVVGHAFPRPPNPGQSPLYQTTPTPNKLKTSVLTMLNAYDSTSSKMQ
eukprot:CAMPEP_0178931304 /NCGR_PEP_ID=MMETSP0786-20121207/21837_1 /TAXON_ID=186022 /ORGANISM="Thalassionema frauenfeldii, Strain CCMP 1798" /LENGTH=105 /DNA_ID=CAMNT_0020608169 /DNA_START=116 /DNA_END=433 /DNA_ORIENTATION=+